MASYKDLTPKNATTREADYYSAPTVKVEFEHKDRLGRTIGAWVRNTVYTWVAKTEAQLAEDVVYAARYDFPAENLNQGEHPAGTVRFGFQCGALRNGKTHQASHSSKYFTTEAERDEAIAKYFKDAAKRAIKGFTKA